MYNDNIAIENFISYCDDMMIAEEGLNDLKSKLIALLNKLISLIEKAIRKFPDSKFKAKMLKLLSKAKSKLSSAKSLNDKNPDLAKSMMNDVNDLQQEYDRIMKEFSNTNSKNEEKGFRNF